MRTDCALVVIDSLGLAKELITGTFSSDSILFIKLLAPSIAIYQHHVLIPGGHFNYGTLCIRPHSHFIITKLPK